MGPELFVVDDDFVILLSAITFLLLFCLFLMPISLCSICTTLCSGARINVLSIGVADFSELFLL
jgi:hypothetical protein